MDWFLYDKDFHRKRVNLVSQKHHLHLLSRIFVQREITYTGLGYKK